MKKKVLAWMLSVCMVLTMMPLTTFANTEGGQPENQALSDTTVATIGSDEYETLQAAIDEVQGGETVTIVKDGIAENVTVPQAPDIKITIDGSGKSFVGTITVNGKSQAYETAGLIIKNVKFDAGAISKDACINLGGNNSIRYISNLTVQDCSFTNGNKTKVGIKSYTGGDKNLVITGCSANDMHSLVQLKNVTGVQIEDCNVTSSKNGISVGLSSGVNISDAIISADGYGIRADGTGTAYMTVSGCTVVAEKPIVVRNATGAYQLTVPSGTYAAVGEGKYGIVFTEGDDGAALVEPTGEYSLNISEAVDTKRYPDSEYTARINGKGYFTLQAAIDAAAEGNNTIELLADSTEDVTIKQSEGINIKIDGNENTYGGTITVHGKARYEGEETLVIENVKFKTSEASHYFIDSNSTASAERYAHNLTVQNCSFEAVEGSAAVNSAVAMRIRQGFNIEVKSTTAVGMHSLLQGYGCAGLGIADVEVNGKNGISVGTSTDVEITGAVIEATGYGLRADGTGAYDMTATDCTITANDPIVVRNATGDYELTVTGGALTAGNESGYGIVFTKGDDGTYEEPTGNVKHEVTDVDTKLYPDSEYVAEVNNKKYFKLEDAIAAAQTGETITLLSDCAENVTVVQAPDMKITIDGTGNTYTGTITVDGKSAAYATAGLTIKNIDFDAANIADTCIMLGNGKTATRYTSNVTIENCTFTDTVGTKAKVGIKSYTGGDKNLAVIGCKATNMHSLLQVKNITGIEITGCEVTGSKNGISVGLSSDVKVNNTEITTDGYGIRADGASGADMTISECTVESEQPVVVRNTTGEYKLTVPSGTYTPTGEGEYGIVFTNGDDGVEIIEPTGEYNFTISEDIDTKTYPCVHKWGDWSLVEDSSCTETGVKERVCKHCNESEEDIIPLKEHTEVIDKAKDATCTETGLTEGSHCSACGKVFVAQEVIKLKEHTLEVLPEVEVTCTTDGLEAGVKCSVCDTILLAQKPIVTEGHKEVIDKAVAPTCEAAGLTEGSHCSVCKTVFVAQEEVPALTHKYKEKGIEKSSLTEDGKYLLECELCGGSSSESIPKIDIVKLEKDRANYDGKAKLPVVVAIDAAGNVIDPENYTVEHVKNIKKIGAYKVNVTFVGDIYEGNTELTFAVVRPAPKTARIQLRNVTGGYDDVVYSWSKVPYAKGYKVYYKKASSSKYVLYKTIKNNKTTKITKKNLTDGVKYNFKVVSYVMIDGKAYESANQKVFSVYTLKKLNTPKVVKSGTKVKVSWNNVNGDTGYQISQATTKTGTNIVSTYKTTKGTYKNLTAEKGTKYYYKVRVYKTYKNGNNYVKVYGPWSKVKAFKR